MSRPTLVPREGHLLFAVAALAAPAPGGPALAQLPQSFPELLEALDHPVWAWTHGLVSGHSLKHVVAALAVLPVAIAVARLAPRGQNAAKLPARAA